MLLVASLVWLVATAYVVFGVVTRITMFLTDIFTFEDASDLTTQADATVDRFWPIWALIWLTVILVPAWFFTLRRLGVEKKRRLLERIKQEIAGIHVLSTEDGYVQWTDRSSPLTASFKLISRGDTTFALRTLVEDIHHERKVTHITFAYVGSSFASSGGDSVREMQQLYDMLQQARILGKQVYPFKRTRIVEKQRLRPKFRGKRSYPVWF